MGELLLNVFVGSSGYRKRRCGGPGRPFSESEGSGEESRSEAAVLREAVLGGIQAWLPDGAVVRRGTPGGPNGGHQD